MTTVVIPTVLSQYADEQTEINLPGATVDAVLRALTTLHPDLGKHLYDGEGKLHSFINVYLKSEDVRSLVNGQAKVRDKDTIFIIPAVAGGRRALGASR